MKVKIGRGARVDRLHLSAVRAAVGPDVELFTDANCAYDVDEATRVSLAAALQLCAVVPNFRIYEYNRLPNAIREQILHDPPVFSGGYLDVPTGPGLGVQVDDDVIDRFTVARY